MTYYIDEEIAKFPDNSPSLEEYSRACSHAIDVALDSWPISKSKTRKHSDSNGNSNSNGNGNCNGNSEQHPTTVRTGFIGDNRLRSTLWSHSYGVNEGKACEKLLRCLGDIFQSDDLAKHASQWDSTFGGASLLAKLTAQTKDDTSIVRWSFHAPPLAKRDMLYAIHRLVEDESFPTPPSSTHSSSQIDIDLDIDLETDVEMAPVHAPGACATETETAKHTTKSFALRWTYSYASVSEDWVAKHCGESGEESPLPGDNDNDNNANKKVVRALNCYPSCDRITVYPNNNNNNNNNSDQPNTMTVVVDHLMTTDVGGWIGPFCFNNLFKSALLKANAHESEAMRDYVLSLCQQQEQQQQQQQQQHVNATGTRDENEAQVQ